MKANPLPPLSARPGEEPALAVLADSDASLEEKARACQQLAVVGSPGAVPALAALLGDEQLAAYARSGLEIINDQSAGEALRTSLAQLNGRLLAGAIVSLGVRRESTAVPALVKFSDSQEGEIRDAATDSLGRIASPEAVESILFLVTKGRPDQKTPGAHAALAAAAILDGDAAAALRRVVREAELPVHIRNAAGK